jgi:hypothetical protein
MESFFFPSQGVLYPYPEGIKVYIKPFPDWSNRLILVMARVQRSGYWPLGPRESRSHALVREPMGVPSLSREFQ